MIKKLKKVALCFVSFAILFGAIFSFLPKKVACAEFNQIDFSSEINEILNEFSQFNERIPGSFETEKSNGRSEQAASNYIFRKLSLISGIKPINFNSNFAAGYQNFSFVSDFDGKKHNSQNVGFTYSCGIKDCKKVIIGTSYDAVAFDSNLQFVKTEGIGQSAGGVALLLLLASRIPQQKLGFDVDFIFFGAGASSNAGSKFYTNGISDAEKNNIALMINLDTLALGKNLYFYVDEIENDFSKFAQNLSNENNFNVNEIQLKHLGKVQLDTTEEAGLSYFHIAQNSDNFNFMKRGILTMNVFAGDYSSGVVVGKSEFAGRANLIYTENDSVSNIKILYGENLLVDNITNCFNFILRAVTDSNLLLICGNSVNDANAFYSFFGNYKLATYLTLLMFCILVCVAFLIYYKLSIKSYSADVEVQFTSSVLSITDNISNGKLDDGEIPRIVSQVMANDIKKDKRIKKRKKKDDN